MQTQIEAESEAERMEEQVTGFEWQLYEAIKALVKTDLSWEKAYNKWKPLQKLYLITNWIHEYADYSLTSVHLTV